MRASIITPLFNKCEITAEFLTTIAPHMEGSELILVDNGSKDDTYDVIKTAKRIYPDMNLVLLSHKDNLGFGTANDEGAKLAKSDNLIFISNDVKILGDFITPTVDYLNEHPNDACGQRVIAVNTGWNNYTKFGVISYIEGYNMAMKKQNYHMVGGFDRGIFIDLEDTELSLRLHLAGVGLRQLTLPLIHTLGGSFSGLSKTRLEYTMKSVEYFCRKWDVERLP